MKIKRSIIIFSFMFVSACLLAVDEPKPTPYNAVLSESRQHVYIGFYTGTFDEKTNSTDILFPSDESLRFGFGATLSENYDVLCLDPAYSCTLSARSDSGEEIKQTRAGQRFGRRFLDVTNFARDQLDYSSGGSFPYLSTAPAGHISYTRKLPPLEQLFCFKKPGKYMVTLQFQCWIGPYNKSTSTNVSLVRFPPVALQVIKRNPEDVQTD